jgi:hypothetical protein
MFAARNALMTAAKGDAKGSVYFDGTGDFLTITATSALQLGTADFTIEFWHYTEATMFFGTYFSTTADYTTTNGLRISTGNLNDRLLAATAGTTLGTASSGFTKNTWNHVALSYNGGVGLNMYQNGTKVVSAASGANFTADTFYIGSVTGAGGPYPITGYISNFRVIKGTALYTGSSLTVPTSPLTAVSGTTLLTCQNPNSIVDASSSGYSITANGNAAASSLSPF